jgi:hemerythrin
MSIIEWREEYSVGIQEIDEEHKQLIFLINELNEAIVLGSKPEKLESVFNQLIDYTRIHFAVEEALMRIVQYKDYDAHKKIHDDITSQVIAFKEKFYSGKYQTASELMNFLINWLFNHINQVDKMYVETFINAGLQRKWYRKFW